MWYWYFGVGIYIRVCVGVGVDIGVSAGVGVGVGPSNPLRSGGDCTETCRDNDEGRSGDGGTCYGLLESEVQSGIPPRRHRGKFEVCIQQDTWHHGKCHQVHTLVYTWLALWNRFYSGLQQASFRAAAALLVFFLLETSCTCTSQSLRTTCSCVRQWRDKKYDDSGRSCLLQRSNAPRLTSVTVAWRCRG